MCGKMLPNAKNMCGRQEFLAAQNDVLQKPILWVREKKTGECRSRFHDRARCKGHSGRSQKRFVGNAPVAPFVYR